VSPHVRRWSERITVDGTEIDLESALRRVRPAAERLRATQFETITAAALRAFADHRVEVAVVEAGLGGRLDATNVLRAAVVLLTSVGRDHTDVLGEELEGIAREKLAVAHVDSIVVLPDNSWAHLHPGRRAVIGGAAEAAEAFVAHPIDRRVEVELPGRLERRSGEIRDGAHNPDGVRWLVRRLPPADYTVCASILRDKDADEMLAMLATCGERLVATSSSSPRALNASELARRGRRHFRHVEAVAEPRPALARAHALGEPVLVTGSLYLLADLETAERAPEEGAGA
jgi:dihydrofolate synthase/folylpolyglutamate synthase